MRKICLLLTAALVMSLFAGCGLIETDNPPTLPKLVLDNSSLTGVVEFVNGRTCRITVTEGDSHFDGPYVNRKGEPVSGDTIQLTYTTLSGSKNVAVGDTVTFRYSYAGDVSEKNGDPHITVHEIKVTD